ncbi:MAG TPA: hypothetical protein VMN79_01015 [Casimicrobiaceae bacterium]|nr:hypothetical protein [Casimicrobiaceae bacterium]
MKVGFDFTPADMAEVSRRAVSRSPLVQRWRLTNSIVAAVLVGLLVFLATPWETEDRSVAGAVVAAIVFAAVFFLARRRGGSARLQAFYRERLGGDGPFTCEVELTSAGVVSRQLGQESLHAWPQVASVDDVPGGVEFVYRPIGSLLVRDRAFPDPGVRAEFLSLARSRISADAQSVAAAQGVGEGVTAPPTGRDAGSVAEQAFATGPTERDYFVAWLLFFVCASVTGSVASSLIGAGAVAFFRQPGSSPLPGVYVLAGISFLLSACLSYVFFRLFARRLVTRVLRTRGVD